MKNLIVFIAIAFSIVGFGQEETLVPKTNKGKIFFYWGWNRGYFSNSDIHFKGDGYDFVLGEVKANDRQTRFALDPYFHPERISIPQTNFKVGYFIHKKYNISFGVDHMKYVVAQGQEVTINGDIDVNGSNYNKPYQDKTIELTPQFLKFEHTDGLNYVNVEINRFDNLVHLFDGKFPIDINFTEGFGIGGLYPKTNARLMNFEQHDDFNVAGFGLNAKVGLDITFFNHFFFRFEGKAGYINMPNIRTTQLMTDKASQQFLFLQRNLLFGGVFRIGKKG